VSRFRGRPRGKWCQIRMALVFCVSRFPDLG
jgi:hypothetical protein